MFMDTQSRNKTLAKNHRFMVLVGMLILLLPLPAAAVQEIVYADKDAQVRQNQAVANFGAELVNDVRSQRSAANLQNRRSMVGFDFTGGDYLGCSVDSATFEMYLEDTTSSRTHVVHPLTGAWGEHTVSWNIASGLVAGAQASSAAIVSGSAPTTTSWTGLASLIQAAVDGQTELTLRVSDSSEQTTTGNPGINHAAQYTSREGAAEEEPAGEFGPRLVLELSCDECETWVGETAWADGSRYQDPGNWATYTAYSADSTVTLYAGQTHAAGTVHFSSPDNGEVTITITLNAGFMFADQAENVKVENYADAPSGNPNPGDFNDKDFADPLEGTFEIVVPLNDFYGVHVDVDRCADDDI
jgi:hypothetical protein